MAFLILYRKTRKNKNEATLSTLVKNVIKNPEVSKVSKNIDNIKVDFGNNNDAISIGSINNSEEPAATL
jgi:hypothetical protein